MKNRSLFKGISGQNSGQKWLLLCLIEVCNQCIISADEHLPGLITKGNGANKKKKS